MKVKNIKIGCDPELFLEKNGIIISAEGKIGGTKTDPNPISDKGHAIQEDNVMIEFNIPASSTKKEFRDNINFVKSHLETLAALQGCVLNYSASAELNPDFLQTDQALEFGCEPDYNVYQRLPNLPPDSSTNLRTCGGHIHIGYENPDQEISENLVKAMDITLGLKSILLDKDDRRKEMYGKAGAFRFKEYGIEYRTLSNFWIKNNELIDWAYNATLKAIELVNSGKMKKINKKFSKRIEDCINSNNKELAELLIEEIKEVTNKVLIK